jgi:hypothetical protein
MVAGSSEASPTPLSHLRADNVTQNSEFLVDTVNYKVRMVLLLYKPLRVP